MSAMTHARFRASWRRGLVRSLYGTIPGLRSRGDVVKWLNTEVCKTSIQRFESARRLHILSTNGIRTGPLSKDLLHSGMFTLRRDVLVA